MTDVILQLSFDYDALDTDTRVVVQQRTEEIKTLVKRAAQDIVDIGVKLIDVKGRLGHGKFGAWLAAEFQWSWSGANKMMQVAEAFKFVNFTNMDFAPSALYLLASPSTSDNARQEALDRAETEEMTYAKARQIVNEYRGINELLEEANDAVIEQRNPMTAPDATRNDHIMQVMGSSASPEWYTPAYVVEYVLKLFGVIHVDPCSNSHEHPTVPAETLYTKDDNGLTQPWYGNVYMNPPYGDEIPNWTERLVAMYRSFKIEQAIALIPGRIDTAWFQPLYDFPMCHVRGRIKFQNADNSAPFPSVIVYLGTDDAGFIEVFKELGPIMKRIA